MRVSYISLNFSNPAPLFLKHILKSPISIIFSYLRIGLIKTFVSSSKKIVKLLDTGGLYTLKQIHLLFEIVNSEQIHSILSDVYSVTVLQIKPFFTNSMRPPPNLSLSFLLLIS